MTYLLQQSDLVLRCFHVMSSTLLYLNGNNALQEKLGEKQQRTLNDVKSP